MTDPMFIVGCDRSGTTLLRGMLDAHPQVAVPPESQVFPQLLRAFSDGTVDPVQGIEILRANPRFRAWGVDDEVVQRCLAGRDAASAIQLLGKSYAAHRGKSIWIDKTPWYVLEIDLLAEAFPDATFVHVVRDGRDVALSLVEQLWGPGQFGEAAMYWRERVRAGDQARRVYGDRVIDLRYEDLVADPVKALTQVLTPLRQSFDPAMLYYREKASSIVEGVVRPEAHQGLYRPLGPTRDWRAVLELRDLQLFDELAGPVLDRHGYERGSAGSVPMSVRLEASRVRGRWALRHIRTRILRGIYNGR